MKNILYVVSTTKFYSGAEWSLFRLVQNLKDRVNAHFVLPDRGELFKKCLATGIPATVIQYIPTGTRALSFPSIFFYFFVNAIYALRLIFLILKARIDIVHINEIYNFPALVSARLAGARTVCHVRAGVLPSHAFRRLTLLILRTFAHRIIWVSDGVKKAWQPGARLLRKSAVIHNVHPDPTRFNPSKYQTIEKDHIVVGMISKFNKQKGHENLVRAAARIRETGIGNIRYSIVGGQMKGHEKYYSYVTGLINSLNLESEFTLHGMSEDVPRLLSEMDILVHPTNCEDAFPTVVLEAMMMKKPVICFDRGGISEQFDHGVSGILVPAGDIGRVAEEIVRLSRDTDTRKSLGNGAREHVLETLGGDNIARAVISVYDSLFDC